MEPVFELPILRKPRKSLLFWVKKHLVHKDLPGKKLPVGLFGRKRGFLQKNDNLAVRVDILREKPETNAKAELRVRVFCVELDISRQQHNRDNPEFLNKRAVLSTNGVVRLPKGEQIARTISNGEQMLRRQSQRGVFGPIRHPKRVDLELIILDFPGQVDPKERHQVDQTQDNPHSDISA